MKSMIRKQISTNNRRSMRSNDACGCIYVRKDGLLGMRELL